MIWNLPYILYKVSLIAVGILHAMYLFEYIIILFTFALYIYIETEILESAY